MLAQRRIGRDLRRGAREQPFWTRAEAIDIRDRLILEISATEGRTLRHERATFRELADFYVSHYVHPAEYIGEQKVSGLRSYRTTLGRLKPLREYFGNRRLRTITYADLHDFYRNRVHTPTIRSKQRTIATVNRELALLRRMLRIAQQEGWIGQNPFSLGESLISPAKEVSRKLVISREEEQRLIAACDDPRRQHLVPILLVALDCGLRFGEIISLTWSDVDLAARTAYSVERLPEGCSIYRLRRWSSDPLRPARVSTRSSEPRAEDLSAPWVAAVDSPAQNGREGSGSVVKARVRS